MKASSLAANVSPRERSVAGNLSWKSRRLRAGPISNASRYTYKIKRIRHVQGGTTVVIDEKPPERPLTLKEFTGELAIRINKLRKENEVEQLDWSQEADDLATQYIQEWANGKYSVENDGYHPNLTARLSAAAKQLGKQIPSGKPVSEVVGRNDKWTFYKSKGRNAAYAICKWWISKDHKAAILSHDFKTFGIGAAENDVSVYYVVYLFPF